MLKSILIQNQTLLNLVSVVYNLLYNLKNIKLITSSNYQIKGSFLKKICLKTKGKKNKIIIGSKARLKNCKFRFIGNNCKVVIGGGKTIITNTEFWCEDDNSTIIIGNDFTMEGGHIASTEGQVIKIGDDCMFSSDIEIRNGDSHSIIDLNTGKRVNQGKTVYIGNRVWLAAHVRVLKGSDIPSNSIIGNSSVVSGKLERENVIYTGIPCKLIKNNIDWNRHKL